MIRIAHLARLAIAIAIALSCAAGLSPANAAVIFFGTELGPEAVGATGSGPMLVEYDDVEHTLQIKAV